MTDKCVLIADRARLVRWALEKDLASRGLSVTAVGTGAEALARLRERSYGLLLIEVALPDRNGLDLLAEIRRQSPDMRIVVVSGEAAPANKRRAFAEGASQFIEKPFDLAEIVSEVDSTFGDYAKKRRHDRYRCRLPLRIAVVTPKPEEAALDLHHLSATAVDTGSGGLRLRTDYPLREGQRLEIEVISRDDPCADFVPEAAMAKVEWSAGDGGRVTAGLSYLFRSD